MGVQALRTGRPAVFLDRDGTVNENVFYADSGKWEAPRSPEDFRLVPQAGAALRDLQAAGFALVLISNQPNFAIGKATLATLAAIHARLIAELAEEGVWLTDAFYCYHHPHGHVPGFSGPCVCRKPSPYYLRMAQRRHGLAMARSWMVGDRTADVGAGRAAGVRTVFVASTGHVPPAAGEPEPDLCVGSLRQAADAILAGGPAS